MEEQKAAGDEHINADRAQIYPEREEPNCFAEASASCTRCMDG